jgi:hypothetical protein
MLFAAAGQCACMAILAGTVANGTKSAGYVATVMLFLFNFFFAVGLLAIPWLCKLSSIPVNITTAPLTELVPAEYAPLAIRTPAASLASASNWIFTFLVVEITPVSIRNIEWRTYIYFAGMFSTSFLCGSNSHTPPSFQPLVHPSDLLLLSRDPKFDFGAN